MGVDDVPESVGKGKKGRKGKGKGGRQPRRTPQRRKLMGSCPWKIGDEIRVRIADVNVASRRLDLVPVD